MCTSVLGTGGGNASSHPSQSSSSFFPMLEAKSAGPAFPAQIPTPAHGARPREPSCAPAGGLDACVAAVVPGWLGRWRGMGDRRGVVPTQPVGADENCLRVGAAPDHDLDA